MPINYNAYMNIFIYIYSLKKLQGMEKMELTPENLEKASGMLKAIAHPVRISIIGYLEDGERLTVSEIHKKVGIEQATASHHLGILRDKGVLSSKREGKNIYYFLKHNTLKILLNCVRGCCSV
jgi:ArsR family transcriptional regulator, virulence genes transcriptional regulator